MANQRPLGDKRTWVARELAKPGAMEEIPVRIASGGPAPKAGSKPKAKRLKAPRSSGTPGRWIGLDEYSAEADLVFKVGSGIGIVQSGLELNDAVPVELVKRRIKCLHANFMA